MTGEDLHKDNLKDDLYFPRLGIGSHIAHYYGDYVRRIFVTVAVILILSSAFVAEYSLALFPVLVFAGVILIVLSALTNPKNKLIMIANCAASLVGIVLFEMMALAAYRAALPLGMIGFQILALAFIFALYMGLKTVRAMELGQIGKRDLPGEFLEERHRDARSHF